MCHLLNITSCATLFLSAKLKHLLCIKDGWGWTYSDIYINGVFTVIILLVARQAGWVIINYVYTISSTHTHTHTCRCVGRWTHSVIQYHC